MMKTLSFRVTALFLFASCATPAPEAEIASPSAAPLAMDVVSQLQPLLWQAEQSRSGPAYEFSLRDQIWTANNPSSRFRALLSPAGELSILSDSPNVSGFEAVLNLRGVGRGDAVLPRPLVSTSAEDNRVENDRAGGLREWYVNGRHGVEQGFTLSERPTGDGDLVFEIDVRGDLRPEMRGEDVMLRRNDEDALRYHGLFVIDAEGNRLSSHLEAAAGVISIHVDDTDASYPIEVDPWIQDGVLSGTAGVDGAGFAERMVMDGDTLAVAGEQVHVYVRNPESSWGWALQASFPGALSGLSGDTLLISNEVFTRTGGEWTLQATLMPADVRATRGVLSGDTVALASSGSGTTDSGAVYIFERTGDVWEEQATLTAAVPTSRDLFGAPLTMSIDTLAIGCVGDRDGGLDSGAVYIFERDGASWSQQAKLTSSDPAPSDRFGASISLAGDTLVVGAAGDDDDGSASGSAYVFARTGSSWSQQAKLNASDANADGLFGFSVSVSASADSIIVGAPGSDDYVGAAYLFSRTGATWAEDVKLTARDGFGGEGLPEDQLGRAVLHAGDSLFVAAPFENSDDGVLYSFSAEAPWSQLDRQLEPNSGFYFGDYPVAISGDTAMVAGNGVYVLKHDGERWIEQAVLDRAIRRYRSVAISGDTAVIGGSGVEVYVRDGSRWSLQATLIPPGSTPSGVTLGVAEDTVFLSENHVPGVRVFRRNGTAWAAGEELLTSDGGTIDAHAIHAEGDTLVLGVPTDAEQGENTGAAYVFVQAGGVWTQQAKLLSSAPAINGRFGYSVSLSSESVLVGSVQSVSAAHLFQRTGITWSEGTVLAPEPGGLLGGLSVSLWGDRAVAVGVDSDANRVAYVFMNSVLSELVPVPGDTAWVATYGDQLLLTTEENIYTYTFSDAVCGDLTVDEGEECDDGPEGSASCTSTCEAIEVDAGAPDGGPDAGTPDSGPSTDAGPTPDAAVPDAAIGMDGSAGDAGGMSDDGGCSASFGSRSGGLWALFALALLARRRRWRSV